jgi:heme/copper-type cytochrome/quinol oxidase subunit 2
MSLEWIVVGIVVVVGLVGVFVVALAKLVGDAQLARDNSRWDGSAFLDMTTTTSAAGSQ